MLSIPASSAVLEQDLSTAGWLIAGSPSYLDAVFTQMMLCLNGTLADIPAETLILTEEGAKDKVPKRLSIFLQVVEQLSEGSEEQEEPRSDAEPSDDKLNMDQAVSSS